MNLVAKSLILAAASFGLAACSSIPANSPVAVLVEIDRPAGASDDVMKAAFSKSLPTYESVNGLQRKYFVLTETQFGGVYLWDNPDAAAAFFDEAWHARIRSTYGQDATLTEFDVVAETPGASPGSSGEDGVVAIVKVGAPWYAPRGTIAGRMEKTIPDYAAIAGLDFKLYTIADGKQIGGIYLWDNAAAAQSFYNDAWHQRIRDTYKDDADLDLYASPVILINR